MKRSILVALGLAATAVAYGQGKINFNNYYASTQTTGVTYDNSAQSTADGVAGLGVGPEMTAILLWGPSTATAISQLSAVAGSSTPFGNGDTAVPGTIVPPTGAGWFTGPTLSINGGTAGSYAFAIEATGTLNGVQFQGFSPVVVGATSASVSSATPNLPDAIRQGSFTVSPVPEPSILALSGIGAAALMLVRRKKA